MKLFPSLSAHVSSTILLLLWEGKTLAFSQSSSLPIKFSTTSSKDNANLVNPDFVLSRSMPPRSGASSLSTSTSLSATSTSSTTTTSSPPTTTITYQPIFDFSLSNPQTKQKSASSFERIDDAIMGGISTSTLRDIPNQSYATWSGICRTDGGGFCGVRTLPFAGESSGLNASGKDGLYMDCQLVSDDEAHRRVWKMTVRTDSSRGELVYQAEYDLQRAMEDAKSRSGNGSTGTGKEGVVGVEEVDDDDQSSWARVLLPFDKFQQVRGPRLIPDGPKLDVSGGIYQIGLTLSKFQMARNTTELENFRPGYFELRIRQIGFYQSDSSASSDVEKTAEVGMVALEEDKSATATLNNLVPDTLSKEEAAKKRPLVLKMLLPLAKIFFSEQANRRKSAMRILREERNMSRLRAILLGVQCRKKSVGGIFPSIVETFRILSIDVFRAVLKNVLKVVLVYPLRLVGAGVTKVKRMLGMKVKPTLRE